MNLTFADVSTSFLDMSQQDIFSGAVPVPREPGFGKKEFAERLDRMLTSANRPGELSDPLSRQEDIGAVDASKVSDILSDKLENAQGHQFVSALQAVFLMLSNGRLENISMDPSGLETLQKLLLKAGFSQEDVAELIAAFSEEMEQGTLTLDQVFDALFELPFEAGENVTEATFLDSSESPFLESILMSLGVPAEKIQEIMTRAEQGAQGLNLDTIIAELQALQKKAFYSNQPFQVTKSETPVETLARQIGLKIETNQPQTVSLDDIIRSLEQLRQDRRQLSAAYRPDTAAETKAGGETSAELLNTLFKSLRNQQKITDKSTFGFSEEKIKEYFEKSFLMTRENDGKTKGLLNPESLKSLKKGDQKGAFKEIEALLDGNTKETAVQKGTAAGIKEATRRSGGLKEKMVEQPPSQAFESRAGDVDVKMELPKAKPAARTLPAYVTQQVGKSIVRAVNQGENSLKIQLKPPELGRLLMTIDKTGNNMRVSILTENHAAREIITQNITELRTVLSNSGVNLERFEVDMSSDFRQSMADARQQAGGSGKRGRNRTQNQGANPERTGDLNGSAGDKSGGNQDGSVHLVA